MLYQMLYRRIGPLVATQSRRVRWSGSSARRHHGTVLNAWAKLWDRAQTRGSDTVAGGVHVTDHLPSGAQSGGDCCSDAGLSRYSGVFAAACALGRM